MTTRPLKPARFACLCLLLLTASSGWTIAQNLVEARILSTDGPVEIRRGPLGGATLKKISFKLNDQLKAGDRIVTGWRGRLVLGLSDGSQAVVAEKTVVEIQDLASSPRELFQMLRGKTRVYIEKLGGKPNPYRINTPTAVIAVRGTLFDVFVDTNETQVFVHEGEVAVSSLLAPDETVLLKAGQATRVRRGQQPTPPTRFTPGRNDDLFRRTPETRPFEDLTDSSDTSLNDRFLRNSRTTQRQSADATSRPTSRQRNPGRRP